MKLAPDLISFTELIQLLQIPRLLAQHLLWVAGIGAQICDNWTGPALDQQKLRRVLLLHDIGNIVKILPANPTETTLQKIYIQKFGGDDHVASMTIARLAGLSKAEITLMQHKTFINNEATAMATASWEQKIAAYADQRAAPQGIPSLMERLLEARGRYKHRPGTSMNNPRTELLIDYAQLIETQVFMHLPFTAAQITTASAGKYRAALETEMFRNPGISLG